MGLQAQARKSVVHCEHIKYPQKFSEHKNDEVNLGEVRKKLYVSKLRDRKTSLGDYSISQTK